MSASRVRDTHTHTHTCSQTDRNAFARAHSDSPTHAHVDTQVSCLSALLYHTHVFICTVRASDKRISCEEEFSDSEDEGDGGRRNRESFKHRKRLKVSENGEKKPPPAAAAESDDKGEGRAKGGIEEGGAIAWRGGHGWG